MNLKTASVIGFFSLPSAALAEANPSAYNAAMAGAPVGAGTCANCGNGIRHHVVCRLEDGRTVFIGTDCAARVGGEPARCIGARCTTQQLAEREARRTQQQAAQQAQQASEAARRAQRAEEFVDLLAALAAQGSEFHSSLANQLLAGDLSERQATYACKALFGPRQNKGNRAAWDTLHDQLIGYSE